MARKPKQHHDPFPMEREIMEGSTGRPGTIFNPNGSLIKMSAIRKALKGVAKGGRKTRKA